MYKLSDLYQAILGAVIRFWDNRFQVKQDAVSYTLGLEIERLRAENSKLINSILSRPEIKTESVEREIETPRPIGKPSWKDAARKLEAESRQRKLEIEEGKRALGIKTNPESVRSVEALEEELGVN